MAKRLKVLIFIPFIVFFTILFGAYWWGKSTAPVSNDSRQISFIIPKGTSASGIAEKLEGEKLIRSKLAFRIYVQISGMQKKIQAGEYTLSGKLSLFQIADRLTKGPDLVWVTIPEGLRREEVADRFIKGLNMADPQGFRTEFLFASKDKEGYLFPDTYLFPKDVSAKKIVEVMLGTFDKKFSLIEKDNLAKRGYSPQEAVILASIIERETRTNEERSIVAGILYNRLEAGWPLQTDATVQYAKASKKCQSVSLSQCNWWEVTSVADREITSPFNTYKFKGLPPSAICSPGLSSLKAAVNPAESEYWFYLHDKSGGIHYAVTSAEHSENIRKFIW